MLRGFLFCWCLLSYFLYRAQTHIQQNIRDQPTRLQHQSRCHRHQSLCFVLYLCMMLRAYAVMPLASLSSDFSSDFFSDFLFRFSSIELLFPRACLSHFPSNTSLCVFLYPFPLALTITGIYSFTFQQMCIITSPRFVKSPFRPVTTKKKLWCPLS